MCALAKKKKNKTLKNEVVQIVSYDITWDQIKDFPDEIEEKLQELYFLAGNDPQAAVKELEPLIEQYPQLPALKNYLTNAYENMGNREEANQVIIETYQAHPEYLFGKCNYARLCLMENNLDEIEKIFDNKFDLKALYPARDVFHISELVALFSLLGEYFYCKGKIDTAKIYLDTLQEMAPDHPLTKHLESILLPESLSALLAQVFKNYEKLLS